MDPAKKQHTYQDLLGYPEGEHVEILAGDIISHPSPLPRHSKVQGALRSFIGLPYDDDDGYGGPGGWWILLEVDVQLGPMILCVLTLRVGGESGFPTHGMFAPSMSLQTGSAKSFRHQTQRMIACESDISTPKTRFPTFGLLTRPPVS